MSEEKNDPRMFLVLEIKQDYSVSILSIHDCYEDAISYLTQNLSYQYELDVSEKFQCVQKSKFLFEIYHRGMFYGKYLSSRFQLIECNK